MFFEKPDSKSSFASKKDKGHRRTQSNSNYDFRQFNTGAQKENDKNFKNMIETHQILDKNQTKQVLDEESRKQGSSQEKHIVVEQIDPSFHELNRHDSADRNFFNFGKKNRNMTTIFGESSDVLKELDMNLSRKKDRTSIHEMNPAKRYEEAFLKEENIFVIPEQNDLLISTEFPNNKINLKKECSQKKEVSITEAQRRDVTMENQKREVTTEKLQESERRDFIFPHSSNHHQNENEDKNLSSSDSKAEHFQSLMHLKSNILKAMAKTNNRYNSKEEIKTSRAIQFKTLKENKENSTIKAKKNNKNSLTINLFKEKPKFSTTATLHLHAEKEKIMDSICKHKKNAVSAANKKDISFSSLKKSEKMEKDFSRLETQVCILKKKVEVLENQNKNFKHQLTSISEEKNLYVKVKINMFNDVMLSSFSRMKNTKAKLNSWSLC